MARYTVGWQLGGETTFEVDDDRSEDSISHEIGQCLDGIAEDVSDDIRGDVGATQVPPSLRGLIAGDGTAEFTLRKLNS